jgi:ABC-type antimicrobial peptide transport system ATPase subunit
MQNKFYLFYYYFNFIKGGQKRKLSLGIALIGNSKVVILDGFF